MDCLILLLFDYLGRLTLLLPLALFLIEWLCFVLGGGFEYNTK